MGPIGKWLFSLFLCILRSRWLPSSMGSSRVPFLVTFRQTVSSLGARNFFFKRREGRGKGREIVIGCLLNAPTGDLACHPGCASDFSSQAGTQSTEPASQGRGCPHVRALHPGTLCGCQWTVPSIVGAALARRGTESLVLPRASKIGASGICVLF